MRKVITDAFIALFFLAFSAWNVQLFIAEAHYLAGERELRDKRHAQALERFQLAAQTLPERSQYQRAIGTTSILLYEIGSGDLSPLYKGHHAYKLALELDPLYPYGWYEMGDVLQLLEDAGAEDMPSSESYYRRAVEIDPTNPKFLFGMFKWSLRHGRIDLAFSMFVRMAKAYPRTINHFGLRVLKTERDLDRMTREVDDDLEANLEYVKFLYKQGRLERAQAQLERIPASYRLLPEAMALRAEILFARNEPEQGKAVLIKALEKWPGHFYLSNHLARALARENDFKGAIETYNKARAANPERWDLDLQIARLAKKDGQDDLAIELYSRILDSRWGNAWIRREGYVSRGAIKHKRGDLAGALAEYEKALGVMPKDKGVIRAIKRIKAEMENE
jgi:tetratricopeptide (TPR) repeat protein